MLLKHFRVDADTEQNLLHGIALKHDLLVEPMIAEVISRIDISASGSYTWSICCVYAMRVIAQAHERGDIHHAVMRGMTEQVNKTSTDLGRLYAAQVCSMQA